MRVCVSVCVLKWTRAFSVADCELVETKLGLTVVGGGGRWCNKGNENRRVFMRVYVCVFTSLFFLRVPIARAWAASLTRPLPVPRVRSAVYLSDTISSYTHSTLVDRCNCNATATRRCRQRGNEIWIRIEWNMRALQSGVNSGTRITCGTNFPAHASSIFNLTGG